MTGLLWWQQTDSISVAARNSAGRGTPTDLIDQSDAVEVIARRVKTDTIPFCSI
jgi:hypothetical protein